jgi:anti-sigma factor (TIGR02949 family)
MASSKDNKEISERAGIHSAHIVEQFTSVHVNGQTGEVDASAATTVEKIDTFDFYSCEEAIKRLNDYLDAELQPGERDDVVKHLQICAPCLERFQFEKTLMVAMRERVCKSMAPLKLKERLKILLKG